MIDTVIISGGNIQNGFALDFLKKRIKEGGRESLALVAADSGMEWFMRNREFIPDLAVGDFDSLSEEGKKYMESLNGLKIIRLKPEKDDSDTQSAVNHMISEGSREILILGATGTRLDHVLANLGLLSMGREKGVHIALADQWNYITLVDSGTVLKKEGQFGKYVSFFTVGGDVSGLTLKGFKYPLDGYDLTVADSGLTVSKAQMVDAPVINEFPLCLECEFVEYQDGKYGCGVIGKVVNVTADESVMENGKLNMSLVNAIAFDPYTHGYYKVTERVGEAFKDGLKLKK